MRKKFIRLFDGFRPMFDRTFIFWLPSRTALLLVLAAIVVFFRDLFLYIFFPGWSPDQEK